MNRIKSSLAMLRKTRTIAFAAMFIALNVLLTRYLGIQTDILRISFEFLPVAVFSMLFGPLPGAVVAALGDVVGFFVFPVGTYMPAFTLCAFVYGLLYGLFLHRGEPGLGRVILGCAAAVLVVDFAMKTVFLSMIYGLGAVLAPRLIKCAVMLPIQVICVYLVNKYLGRTLRLQLEGRR